MLKENYCVKNASPSSSYAVVILTGID